MKPSSSPPSAPPKRIVNSRKAAEYCSISERTLWGNTAPRGSLPCFRIGNRVLYDLDAVDAWIDLQVADSSEVQS